MSSAVNQDLIEVSNSALVPSKPMVSVLMITYNHEGFLLEAIESIVNQSTDFLIELVIGEDCSTDNTRQVVLDFQKRYPSIIRVIYSKNNVGANNNFARTLYACKGKYIAVCEGDDYWNDTSKLQKQVDVLEGNQNCVVTYHDAYYLKSYELGGADTLLNESSKKKHTSSELVNYSFMPTLTMCFRNVLPELPPEFFKVVNADTFLISLLGGYGDAIYISDISPAMYREHEGGVWSGLEPQDKKIRTITTFYWMMLYYNRMNKSVIASRYACAVMSHVLSLININKMFFMKWFLMNFFSDLHVRYYKIKCFISKHLFKKN